MEAVICIITFLSFLFSNGENRTDEIMQYRISPSAPNYNNYNFQVVYQPAKMTHDKYEIYDFLVVVSCTNGIVQDDGYIEIWDADQFVYSGAIPPSDYDSIRSSLKSKNMVINKKKMIFYSFRINPKYLDSSRFYYRTCQTDADCYIYFQDFVKFQNSSKAIPKSSTVNKENKQLPSK